MPPWQKWKLNSASIDEAERVLGPMPADPLEVLKPYAPVASQDPIAAKKLQESEKGNLLKEPARTAENEDHPERSASLPLLTVCHYEISYRGAGRHWPPAVRVRMKSKNCRKERPDRGDPFTRDICLQCLDWLEDQGTGFKKVDPH